MKTKKYCLAFFPFYDYTGIERRLTEMASKGWLIENMSDSIWVYRRIEPMALHFSVQYFPRFAADYEPCPSEEQQAFLDFCAHSGWQYACGWSTMQVFYNAQPEPLPIDTDPVIRLENINKGCKRSFTPCHTGIIYISMILLLNLFTSAGSFHNLFSHTINGVFLSLGVLILLLSALQLLSYFFWYTSAKKTADRGNFLPAKSLGLLGKGSFLLFSLTFFLSLASLFCAELSWESLVFCIEFLLFSFIVLVMRFFRAFFRRRRIPTDVNITLTYLAGFAVFLIIVSMFIFLASGGRPG